LKAFQWLTEMLIYTQLESDGPTVLPAGNSREQHPSGGRNCFTITMQSLWRVLFRMAIIPTPVRHGKKKKKKKKTKTQLIPLGGGIQVNTVSNNTVTISSHPI